MPIRLDERRKPASVKVHVSSGAGVDIAWSDGHASHYDFGYLREKCPCAMCNAKLNARAAHAVGNYALQIDFNDGHTTGIFSFDYLRTICSCEDCAREFRTP